MGRHPNYKLAELKPQVKLRILESQIAITTEIVRQLAEHIEATADRLGREPTQSEEAAVNFHRATLRRYLQRHQQLSCAMHSDRKDTIT